MDDDFFQQSEESSQFRNEYEMRKIKQACNLHDLFLCFVFNPLFVQQYELISISFKTIYLICLQDEGLDFISEGLDTLKNLAEDMNEVNYPALSSAHKKEKNKKEIQGENKNLWHSGSWKMRSNCFYFIHFPLFFQELDRQVPLVDEIETKVCMFLLCPLIDCIIRQQWSIKIQCTSCVFAG